jgi:hypothetical protein
MYTKPAVTKLASALKAIQHPNDKSQQAIVDSPALKVATPAAYAADE